MSVADWFTFKSAKQRAKEAKMYARWAFPYGDAQKEKILQLIGELMPKEDPKAGLAVFLIGRQAYLGAYDDDPEDLEERKEAHKLEALNGQLENQLFGRYKKNIPFYKALILAAAKVDASLNYPAVEELRRMAEELMKE